MTKRRSTPKGGRARSIIAAGSVHVLTASGAVFGLLALTEAADGRWADAFLWLGLAMFVDGVDGPLARALNVQEHAPRFDGQVLDLVVDYLNYVAVPAFILSRAAIVPEGTQLIAASAILLTALFHFSDRQSKTADGFFVGFPAVWNVIVLYLLVLAVPPWPAIIVVFVLALLTFVPLKWVHPFRARPLRPLTFLVTAAWAAAALWAVWTDFAAGPWVKAAFVVAAVYFVAVGLCYRRLTTGGER